LGEQLKLPSVQVGQPIQRSRWADPPVVGWAEDRFRQFQRPGSYAILETIII
jgi:hypothetical protein